MNRPHPSWAELTQLRHQLRDGMWELWLHDNLFSFPWWLILATLVLSAAVWWKLVDKARSVEIALYGSLVALTTTVLDVAGTTMLLWGYPTMLLPVVPPVVGIDLGPLPTIYALVYQSFSTWRSFFLATVMMAAGLAFLAEPLVVWLGIYQPLRWHSGISFFIYIAIALLLRWVVHAILAISKTRQRAPS